MAILPRFRLTNGQHSAPGVSSYRATFRATMSRLVNNTERLTDEQFFNNVASLLNSWFIFEREFVDKDSQTLVEILSSRGLLAPEKGIR